MNDEAIIAATACWIKQVVVDLNLCPFAAPVVEKDVIFYSVSHGEGEQQVFGDMLDALNRFQQMEAAEAQTGFLILSRGLSDFADFNDFFDLIDQLLEESGLNGIIQIVGFHPDYCFADTPVDDPANYTNRSPYPMFHLILEDDLESAVASHPDPASIPERNIKLLREMGEAEMKRRLDACLG